MRSMWHRGRFCVFDEMNKKLSKHSKNQSKQRKNETFQ